MQMETQFARIGSDIRWILGGERMLRELLRQHLSPAAANEAFKDGFWLATASRQVAIRQAIADGVSSGLAPGDAGKRQREEIRRRIEDITELSSDQANRILNGVGQFTGAGGDITTNTVDLAEKFFERNRNYAKDLDVELLYSLSMGASESIESFVLKPFQFAANTAAAALRLRINKFENQTEFDSLEDVRHSYPRLTNANIGTQEPQDDQISPTGKMSLYGLYLWQAGSTYFEMENAKVDRESFLLCDAIERTIRWAPVLTPGVFPDLVRHPELIPEARSSSTYQSLVIKAVNDVASNVGKALLGDHPYDRKID
jgi:hypothetical protein